MIRLATTDDSRIIAELYHDIRQDTVPTIHTIGEIEWFISNRLIARGSSFVFEQDGEIVGWLDVHDGWVDQLYCRRSHTGKGIGKRLLVFAKERNPNGLQLWTFQVNEGARRFYAREGFEEVEITDGANNEERAPDVRLVWTP